MLTFSANEIKDVYAKLQDDESRSIFNSRLAYFLDGDEEHLWKIVDRLYLSYSTEIIRECNALRNSGKKIVFYGAGVMGGVVKNCLARLGFSADFFIDKSKKKQCSGYLGLPVLSLQQLKEKHPDAAVIVTASKVYAREIKHELISSGFNCIFDDLNKYVCESNYFIHDFLAPQSNETFIDCGTLDGESILDFIKFSNGVQKIYGFEPDAASYSRTKSNLENNGLNCVEMVNKGVWGSTTELGFVMKGDGGSHLSSSCTIKVPVTTIDETVKNENITFIKMDIEGAELEALRGASSTIRRCKPRLAICAYHKPEDMLELPLYIQSIVPEYGYFLRHCSFNTAGSVLYAILK